MKLFRAFLTLVISLSLHAQGIIQPLQYQVITGTTATSVTTAFGNSGTLNSRLVKLIVGTPAAGTVGVFDLNSANCTGSPSNPIILITFQATPPPFETDPNMQFSNGICIKASVAMTISVGYN